MAQSLTSIDAAERVQIDERHGSLYNNSRLHPLRNRPAPIDGLPDEVLSGIMQQVMDPDTDPKFDSPFLDPIFDTYSTCLSQALTLSVVSSHFRHVAFCTPDLWKRIPINAGGKIDRVSAAVQHCMLLTPYVKASIREGGLDGETAFSVIETLLTPEMAQKMKALDLRCSTNPSLWLNKLQVSSFPILDCLIIETGVYGMCREISTFDFGAHNSVTKLILKAPQLELPVGIPSSVQVLSLNEVPQEVQISILYQCPNLVECFSWYADSYPDSTGFANPLTLKNLKRLNWGADRGLETMSSVQNLQLPALQILDLLYDEDQEVGPDEEEFESIKLFCSNVSATLTTFSLYISSTELEYQNLRQLFSISFPHLQKLDIRTECDESPQNVLQALTPMDDDCSDSEPRNLPSLKSLIVGTNHRVGPRFLLDLLKKWKVGEASHFYLEMKYSGQLYRTGHEDWSPELRDEFSLIVGNRQLEVVWDAQQL